MDQHFLRAKEVARMIEEYLNSEDGRKPADLQSWLDESEEHRALFDDLLSGSKTAERLNFYDSVDASHEWKLYLRKRFGAAKRRRNIIRWTAGVAASLLVAVASWFMLTTYETENPDRIVTGEYIYPGERKALFIAGDREIEITGGMDIRNDRGTVITDNEGSQVYESDGATAVAQRIVVPRSGEYDITLGHGTGVWRNSETGLIFPEKFASGRREITIKGEAYLEVAHKPASPFYVNVDNTRVRVMGTSFVVNSYDNEGEMKVSLLSGKVRMETPDGAELARLSPAQQFSIDRQTGTVSISGFDRQSLLDWKNNLFIFEDESLASIARRLERWYDIEITVDPELQDNRYSGVIERHSTMQPIIFILTNTGEMDVLETVSGRIVIRPKQKNS